jgi:hypothetical protein
MLALNFDQAVEYFMILTNAELAVILEIVLGDDLPLDAAGMRDLGATAEDLAAARAVLVETGRLVRTGRKTCSVAAPVVDLLAVAFSPKQLLVLQVQDREQPPRQISYSRAGAAWVRHTLRAPGEHEYTGLASGDAVADNLLADTHVVSGNNGAVPAERAPLADVLSRAVSLGLLATGPLPGHDAPPAALSWVAAGDGVWWINPAGPPETAQRCAVADLKELLVAMVR